MAPITIFEQSITRTTPETKQSKQPIQRATYTMARQNNHFDIRLKHTAGKEIKFTDFISRNPTKNPEPEENYKEALVINAIAHGKRQQRTDFKTIRWREYDKRNNYS